jgi:hypothetical protein
VYIEGIYVPLRTVSASNQDVSILYATTGYEPRLALAAPATLFVLMPNRFAAQSAITVLLLNQQAPST